MRALLHTEPYHLEYTEVPVPEVGANDVLVHVKACGICGSDVHGVTGKTGRRIPPVIMGHEAAGIVERVGRSVASVRGGDRICFDSTVYCNACPACRKGLTNRCEKRQVLGVSTPEFRRHGAMAEYVAVPWWIVSKIPDSLSFVQAALLEPVSIALHACNRASIRDQGTVVVMGAGTVGLCVLQAARLRGAATVIAVDINGFRLDMAKTLGADRVFNSATRDATADIVAATGGKGADVSFEVVGLGETFRQAVSMTCMGGQVVAVGNLRKNIEFNLQDLVTRELSFTGSCASSGEFSLCVELIASGKVRVEPLISDVVPLSDGARAFERLLKAEENLVKIVLEP